jgi:urease accessory protein
MAGTALTAHAILRAGLWSGAAWGSVTLDYEGRFLRRRLLVTDSGVDLAVDLPETVSLGHGDAFETTDGRLVAVIAAPEDLLAVTGPDLARLAWHIGNRHTPAQIEAERILIRADHVLAGMLSGLGADLEPVTEPFTPEGGAYGHGRTLGHDHGTGHSHGPGQWHAHD